MNLYSAINQVLIFVYLFLGLRALLFNPRGKINKIFFFLNLCFSVWAFGSSFVYISPDKASALFWFKFSSIGFITFPFFLVMLFNNVISKYIKFKTFILHSIFIFPVIIFLYWSFSAGLFTTGFRLTLQGWQKTGSFSTWKDYAFLTYYILTIIGSSVVYFLVIQKKGTKEEKKIMKVISGISVIAFAVIAVTNIFLPKYGYNLPTQGPIFTILVVFGAWYVIENYSFLKPTIEDVAKTTLELIQDGVVITDKEGKIISANKVAAKLLGYSNQDLPQKKLIDYIDKGAAEYAFWKRKEAGIISAIKQSSVKLNGKSGQISVNFSVSVLKDRSGFFEGYVAVLHDIRKIIMMQEQELKNNKEIQEAYLLLKMEEMDLRNIQEKMIKEELEMITLKQNINNELLKSKKGTRYTEKRSLA